MNISPIQSLNGTLSDVAAFFRVTERTVKRWKMAGQIGAWQLGGALVFGEDDVVKLWRGFHRDAEPGSELEARRLWREHLGVRSAESGVRKELEGLVGRVAELERRLEWKEGIAA